ncbi:MAG: transglutaminase domain-containing protein [Bacteroidales bacterium]|nr:transglutaminase domain-containing protein [Bacteroidales bacterium]
MMKNTLFVFILVLILFSCNKQNNLVFNERVMVVLDSAQWNEPQLLEVIIKYNQPKDSLKLKATYFLIENMEGQVFESIVPVDSLDSIVEFDARKYYNYTNMLLAWDSSLNARGNLIYKCKWFKKDYDTITSDLLINNIDFAFLAREKFLWAKQFSFDKFCEYVLPYRVKNELLYDWRPFFLKQLSWLEDSMKNSNDIFEANRLINNYLRSWFRYNQKYDYWQTDQTLEEMLEDSSGRIEDIAAINIMALRSVGIPATTDYIPYPPSVQNDCFWNIIYVSDNEAIPFYYSKSDSEKFKIPEFPSKVYRTTYKTQLFCPANIELDSANIPENLNKLNYSDVSEFYNKTKDVEINLTNIPDSTKFAYICVFDSTDWIPIHWGEIIDDKAIFFNMGVNNTYLPAFYKNNEIIPAGNEFFLNSEGNKDFRIRN